jgi:hypothetical protein
LASSEPTFNDLPSISQLSLSVAFYERLNCPTTRLIGSADMKPPFGATLARFCFRSTPWIAANHRRGGAASLVETDKNYWLAGAMIVDFAQPHLKCRQE